jgi:hypothetical protein
MDAWGFTPPSTQKMGNRASALAVALEQSPPFFIRQPWAIASSLLIEVQRHSRALPVINCARPT